MSMLQELKTYDLQAHSFITNVTDFIKVQYYSLQICLGR